MNNATIISDMTDEQFNSYVAGMIAKAEKRACVEPESLRLTATLTKTIQPHNRQCYSLNLDGESVSIISVWFNKDIDEPDVTLAARRLNESPRNQIIRDQIKAAVVHARAASKP